ncbi:MAG: glycine--tRNA ligase [Dehalococcoidia bacterium]
MTRSVDMTKIVSLAKRRGFVFPSSEIYGGVGSTWDYGPLGVELKRNVKDAWWRSMVYGRDDVVGLDSAIIQNPQVWVASGHAEGFTDPLVECPKCQKRFRPDHLEDPTKCPDDGTPLSEPRMFNLMFETHAGPVKDSANRVWLRPETAQGIFINFDNVVTATRMKLPFGIAQVGKSFRNEITPGNFIFRTREFEQMEMEFFVKPGEDDPWHQHWIDQRKRWYEELGIRPENLRLREHEKDELAHYAKGTSDVEYLFPWGWAELEGIANRTDFDLRRHSEFSGKELTYFDQESNSHYYPYVIEPAAGVDRAALAFMVDAYDEEEAGGETRVVLKFHPDIAPIKVAVLPLSRNEKLGPTAREVHATVRKHFASQYDDAQSIGRRYRRQDEIGTPLCVTVDFQTVEEDQAVTIRNRDSMEQVRVPIAELAGHLHEQLASMGGTRG